MVHDGNFPLTSCFPGISSHVISQLLFFSNARLMTTNAERRIPGICSSWPQFGAHLSLLSRKEYCTASEAMCLRDRFDIA